MKNWNRLFLVWSAIFAFGIGTAHAAPKVTKAYLVPVRDTEKYSPPHGDVYLLYSNKKRVRMTKSGMCDAPKVAPGGRTYGWIEGRKMNWSDGSSMKEYRVFVPVRIVIFSGGRRLRSLTPTAQAQTSGTEASEVNWCFRKGARQVVVFSRRSHGPDFYQLFDVRTGKEVQKQSFDKPSWANGLKY